MKCAEIRQISTGRLIADRYRMDGARSLEKDLRPDEGSTRILISSSDTNDLFFERAFIEHEPFGPDRRPRAARFAHVGISTKDDETEPRPAVLP